ncbi:MAG: PASTA domain-containing protein [Candidatus Eremiobacteraeota bacterium]|nr:PASTA domain-containing protein [Candidatus Eremiobacteraeota bacterium]
MRRILILCLLLFGLALAQETPPEEDAALLPEGLPDATQTTETPRQVIPPLVFHDFYEVESALREMGVRNIKRIDIPAETPSGMVLYIFPNPGQAVPDDGPVRLFVSRQIIREKPEKTAARPTQEDGTARLFGVPVWLFAQLGVLLLWWRLADQIDQSRCDDSLTLLWTKKP